MKIMLIAGARPNFMKIAPLIRAFKAYPEIDTCLVHTGQHYDERMSQLFFRQLKIPNPDVNLNVGSGSHAQQTADIMKAFEPVLLEYRPQAVLVVGDVNSTIACGLVAVKLGIKLIHVEAGLRSGDRAMPEEINRILTDSIADMLFCTEQSGVDNLRREGVIEDRVFLSGHVMIDTLLEHRKEAESSTILKKLNINGSGHALLTLHRPRNVDDPSVFQGILRAIEVVQKDMPVVFPVHPRTRNNLREMGIDCHSDNLSKLLMVEPLGYLDFLKVMSCARLVLTDSGGVQEETTALKVPCLTLRDNTERPATIDFGSNQVVGTKPEAILQAYQKLKSEGPADYRRPPLWDGHAAERIVETIAQRYGMAGSKKRRVCLGIEPDASIRRVKVYQKAKAAGA
jgi:UDP-N-acetylglucosamine 2-epimerase (non-hydrolysing)